MDIHMKLGQREIVRIATGLLVKKCEKAKKLLEELQLPTADLDALWSRVGLVADAIGVPEKDAVHLTFALCQTLYQGLQMYLDEITDTIDDELKLGIDTEGSKAKIDEIKALAAQIAEQRNLGGEIFNEIRKNKSKFEAELQKDLPEGTTVTIS